MRKFSSYGLVGTDLHYYAPRTELVEHTYHQLRGDDRERLLKDAPRQR